MPSLSFCVCQAYIHQTIHPPTFTHTRAHKWIGVGDTQTAKEHEYSGLYSCLSLFCHPTMVVIITHKYIHKSLLAGLHTGILFNCDAIINHPHQSTRDAFMGTNKRFAWKLLLLLIWIFATKTLTREDYWALFASLHQRINKRRARPCPCPSISSSSSHYLTIPFVKTYFQANAQFLHKFA